MAVLPLQTGPLAEARVKHRAISCQAKVRRFWMSFKSGPHAEHDLGLCFITSENVLTGQCRTVASLNLAK